MVLCLFGVCLVFGVVFVLASETQRKVEHIYQLQETCVRQDWNVLIEKVQERTETWVTICVLIIVPDVHAYFDQINACVAKQTKAENLVISCAPFDV